MKCAKTCCENILNYNFYNIVKDRNRKFGTNVRLEKFLKNSKFEHAIFQTGHVGRIKKTYINGL